MKIFPLNGKLPDNNRVWEDKGMTHVGHQRVLEDKDVSCWLSTLETLTSEEEDKLVYQGWKCLQVKERECVLQEECPTNLVFFLKRKSIVTNIIIPNNFFII